MSAAALFALGIAAIDVPIVGAVVDYRYDQALVALSLLISVLGSYVALWLTSSHHKGQDKVSGPAFALGGCAIWSMHFIGMAAYKTPLYVSYSLLPTLLSLVIAIVITGLGFHIVHKGPERLATLASGGAVIGGGVIAMHYLGMFGMDVRARVDWNWAIVAASVAIAVLAATAALWLAFNVKTTVQRVVAAVAMGGAVCAMHYTGMAAATLVCVTQTSHSDYRLDGPYLAYAIFGVAVAVLGSSMALAKLAEAMQRPV